MNTLTRLILVAVLAFGSGCAKSDWIQQTLVTVDVTGAWRSIEGALVELALNQQGSKATRSVQVLGLTSVATHSAPVLGTVGGDVFSFTGSGPNGSVAAEMTVSGDEMIGEVRGTGVVIMRRKVTLRRIDSSAPPRSQ